MFAATEPFMHALCTAPDEWNGVFSMNTARPPLAARDAFVPALPHSSRPSSGTTNHSHSETDRCLRRSYALVEKLRHAVSL